MSGCGCSQADHDALRDDDVAWATLAPARLGEYQPREIEGKPDWWLRDAPCGSTLYRACSLTDEERERHRRENRIRALAFEAELREAMARFGLRFVGRGGEACSSR